jgi:hypothetical protein
MLLCGAPPRLPEHLGPILKRNKFGGSITRQMGSIEAAFISLARYIREYFPHLTWFPLWYVGIPFADAYPPLLHFLVAGVSDASGASPGLEPSMRSARWSSTGPPSSSRDPHRGFRRDLGILAPLPLVHEDDRIHQPCRAGPDALRDGPRYCTAALAAGKRTP